MQNSSRQSPPSPCSDHHELQELSPESPRQTISSLQIEVRPAHSVSTLPSNATVVSQQVLQNAIPSGANLNQRFEASMNAPPQTSTVTAASPTVSPSATATNSSQISRKPTTFWSCLKRMWYYGWVAEISSCFLAVESLLAMTMMLYMHENKPLPRWPLSITVNALVSIFVALIKAGISLPLTEGISQLKWQWFRDRPQSLVDLENFDAASRDTWSALLFLFQFQDDSQPKSWLKPWSLVRSSFMWRRWNFRKRLAKFAAFLALLAFITDPFTQQILDYESCALEDTTSEARISRAFTYEMTGGMFDEFDYDIDGPMSVAINRGIIDPPPDSASLVASRCESGNCTFPPFSTLGYCHSCEDISDQIQNKTGKDTKGRLYTNLTIQGSSLQERERLLWIGGSNTPGSKYIILQSSLDSYGSQLPSLSLSVLMSGPLREVDLFAPESGPRIDSARAFNCSMAPCVRSYNVSMTNSVLKESLLAHEYIGQNQLSPVSLITNPTPYGYLLATNTTWRNGQLEQCVMSKTERGGLVRVATSNIGAAPDYPTNFTGNYSSIETRWIEKDCVWTFGVPSFHAIESGLSEALDNMKLSQFVLAPLEFPHAQPKTSGGPMAAKNIWKNGTADLDSMDKFMAGLTDSITAAIRANGKNGPAEWVIGNEWKQSTCIRVRWNWFAYPAILVGLAIIFLIVLIWQSPDRVAHRGWKSSSLAVLFCSVDDSIHVQTSDDHTREEVLNVGKNVKAQLVTDGEGRALFVKA